eukprot:scaffold179376_cov53-Cyclotella_meneghiniana.AAC.1
MEVLAAWTLWGNSAVMGRGMVPLLGSSQLKWGVGGRGVVCSRRQTKCRATLIRITLHPFRQGAY